MNNLLSSSNLFSSPIRFKYFFYFSPILLFFDVIKIQSVFWMFVLGLFLLENISTGLKNIVSYNFFIWMILLLWGLFEIINSFNLSIAYFQFQILILAPFCIFIIFTNIDINEEFLVKFFNILFITGVILSIISIFILIDSGFDLKLRIPSIWTHYNLFAAYLMILFMFNLAFLVNTKVPSEKIVYSVSLFIMLLGLFLTQTRGVWLATLFAISIFVLRKPKVIVPVLSVLLIIVIAFFSIIQERLLTVVNFGNDISSLGRLQAWMAALIMIKGSMIYGHGFDAFRNLMDSIFPAYFVVVTHAHNTYLQLMLELGIVGFLLYISFFVKAVYYSFKFNKKSTEVYLLKYYDGLQLSFIGLIIAFFFEPYFTVHGAVTFMIWILISLSFVLKLKLNKKEFSE